MTTTYTIAAGGAGSTTTANATVTVIPPPTVNFSVERNPIIEGETTVLGGP